MAEGENCEMSHRHAALFLLAYASGVAAWGYCNDNDVSCANWVKNGECEGKNKDFMKSTCPHSCGTCHHLCRDVEEGCRAWADGGQCEENKDYMFKNCPTSCGLCKPKCYDKEPKDKCGEWARAGECKKNPAILASCPVSCGVCHNMCLDQHNDCPQWASGGDCHKNTAFMLRTCPKSCNVCDVDKHGTSVCEDRDHAQCLIWGEHECGINPEALLSTCPKLCGACTLACADKSPDCVGWAKANKCEEDKLFMWPHCPYSCGICGTMDVFKSKAKDEI